MGQLALIEPEFTKKYLRAVEKCSIIPSIKVIELFAGRLGVPVTQLLRASVPHNMNSGLSNEKDLIAFQEDLDFQLNYIKMLIKEGTFDEALRCLDWADIYAASAGQFASKVPRQLLYRIPLLRATIYLHQRRPNKALPFLEKAISIIGDDEERAAKAHNMLGVAYYLLERPELAVQEHLICLRAIQNGALRDLAYQSSVLGNLGNAYVVIGDSRQAIATFKLAFPILEDLNDPERNASIFHGLGKAHADLGDTVTAILWYNRAREIYTELNRPLDAAELSAYIAEIMMGDGRDSEAEPLLKQATDAITDPANGAEDLLLAYINKLLADWALHHGQLDQAEEYARISLEYGEKIAENALAACQAVVEQSKGAERRVYSGSACHPIRSYVEALHVAAQIAEARGEHELTDKRFANALSWATKTAIHDTIHAVTLGYAKAMEERGADKNALAFYKAAAQANRSLHKKNLGPAILVG